MAPAGGLAPAVLRAGLITMMHIRCFEERVRKEFAKGDMPGFVHTYLGAEAVAAGVIAHLDDRDLITSTHRGHGHCLAKGAPVPAMVAELYGRETGLCRGRGGSMHIADFSHGMLGANAIVGGGIALAVGGALAAQTLEDGRVSVAFFGDGAANEGVFHESLNLAAIWRLPVVFVCENNGWAKSTPITYSTSVVQIAHRAASYAIPGETVDGSDFVAMYAAADRAVTRARAGEGPSLIEATITRLDGHYVGDPQAYRQRGAAVPVEVDPVARLREVVINCGTATEAELSEIEQAWHAELDAAYDFARDSAWPDPAEVERYVFAG
jgi:pyruvate dehydrogenase E1 component alpha subunit